MTRVRVALLLCLCILTVSCHAQSSVAQKVLQDIPRYGEGIRYQFPENVSKIINDRLTPLLSDRRAFIEISSQGNDVFELYLYTFKKTPVDSTDQIDIILASTNRFYLIDSTKIAVIFEMDYNFGFLSSVFTHTTGYVKFKANKWYVSADILASE